MGGGSSSVPVHYVRAPLDALRDRMGPEVEIVHEPAVEIARSSPEVPGPWLSVDGTPGMTVEFYRPDDLGGNVVHTMTSNTGAVVWFGATPQRLGAAFSWRAFADLTVEEAGHWTISLVQTDPARLLIDGVVVLDGFVEPLPPRSRNSWAGQARAHLECRPRTRPAGTRWRSSPPCWDRPS